MRTTEAAAIAGEQDADQEYYDLKFRHGEKLSFQPIGRYRAIMLKADGHITGCRWPS
jgi:hypothetical protein